MGLRKWAFIMITLMIAQIGVGCSTFGEKVELPEGRNVKVVVFPVRPLKYFDLECRQELESFSLTGAIKNVSPSTIGNVNVRAIIIFANEGPTEAFDIPLYRPLRPGEMADILLSGEVTLPIALIELHTQWEHF